MGNLLPSFHINSVRVNVVKTDTVVSRNGGDGHSAMMHVVEMLPVLVDGAPGSVLGFSLSRRLLHLALHIFWLGRKCCEYSPETKFGTMQSPKRNMSDFHCIVSE